MWVINNECSKDMIKKKENFYSLKKIKEGSVRFVDNARGKLVDDLKHNLLSNSQVCNTRLRVLFKVKNCSIKHNKRDISLIEEHIDNIYVLNSPQFYTLTYLTMQTNDTLMSLSIVSWLGGSLGSWKNLISEPKVIMSPRVSERRIE